MSIVRGDDATLGGAQAAMVLSGPPWLGDVPAVFRDELDFFAFPTIDPAVPRAETVGPYGYMVPSAGEHLPEALALVGYLASPEAQQRIAASLANSAAAQAPLHSAVDRAQLPAAVQQGMALVEGADAVVTQFMPSTPDALWQTIGNALNRFLRDPADVDSFLLALEGARQQADEQGLYPVER
jgi:ABC-type glycerol-3-phosphate transport system substrate-binding protein